MNLARISYDQSLTGPDQPTSRQKVILFPVTIKWVEYRGSREKANQWFSPKE